MSTSNLLDHVIHAIKALHNAVSTVPVSLRWAIAAFVVIFIGTFVALAIRRVKGTSLKKRFVLECQKWKATKKIPIWTAIYSGLMALVIWQVFQINDGARLDRSGPTLYKLIALLMNLFGAQLFYTFILSDITHWLARRRVS